MLSVRRMFVILFALSISSGIVQSQWVQTTGPEVRGVVSLAASGTSLFAGCSGLTTVFHSTDHGSSWTAAVNGFTTMGRADAFAFMGEYVFVGRDDGFYRSTDNGSLWSVSNAGFPPNLTSVHSLAVKDSLVFAGTNYGVYRSLDGGLTWTECNGGIVGNRTILSLAVHGTDIYAGIGACAVYRSTNDGASWTLMDNGFPPNPDGVRPVNSLAFIRGNLFAGISGGGGVALSTNRGESWTPVNAGLTDTSVCSMTSDGSNLFAGTAPKGLLVSTNNGTSWKSVSEGLPPDMYAHALAVSGPYLFAGVYNVHGGAGVWRRALSEILSVEPKTTGVPTGFLLEQNYPNPFNPSTTIRYALPQRSQVTLAVFNTLGQQVATLVNGEVEPGHHEVMFNPAGLASGVYFYRLQAGNFTLVRKLCFIR